MGSSHQYWYVEFPLTFLAMPLVTTAVAIKIRSGVGEWRFRMYLLFIFLLLSNLAAFFIYALMSGGGV